MNNNKLSTIIVMGLLISMIFNFTTSLPYVNLNENPNYPSQDINEVSEQLDADSELKNLDARSTRAAERDIESTDQGGSWTDSFLEDSGIEWAMSDHINRTIGDIKIDTCKPKPFEVDNYTRALWHFDEGSGTTAKDASPNNNDGSLSGPTWTTGRYNGGLDFNAGSQRVGVSSSSSLNFGVKESFTLEAWVKTAAAQKNILCKYVESASYPAYYQLHVRNDGSGGFAIRCANAHQIVLTTVTRVDDNKWHYIAGVRDTENDKLYIYLDGKFQGEANDTTTGAISTAAGISIGKYYGGSALNFDGIMDEIRISNVSRSAQEIKRAYGYLLEWANLTSNPIQLPENMAWDTIVVNKTQPANTYLNFTILNAKNNQPIPGSVKYTQEGEFDISYIDPQIYPEIKLNATFKGNNYNTPVLHFWGASWNLTNNWIDTFFAGAKTDGKFNVQVMDGTAKFKNSGILRSSPITIPIDHYYDKFTINMDYPPSCDFYFSIIDAQSNLEINNYRDLSDHKIDLSGLNPLAYPAIKVKVHFDALGAQTGEIFDWSVNWTQNHGPKILEISSNSAVNRTRSAIISVNLADSEEAENKLSLQVNCKGPDDPSWNTEYLSSPTYYEDHWVCLFTPDKDADLGLYSFNFICNDSCQFIDSCIELNKIEVINNKPTMPDVLITPREPKTNDDLIVIAENSTDAETEEHDLKYWYRWYKNTQYKVEFDNWTIIPDHITSKNEHWRCMVFPFDGVELGTPDDDAVIIQNSAPGFTPDITNGIEQDVEHLRNIIMLEDTIKVLKHHLYKIFLDNDNDTLSFEAVGQNHILVEIFQDNGTIELIPAKDWFGIEYITLIAKDPFFNTINFVTKVEVLPDNDLPTITQVGNQPTFTGYPELTFFMDEDAWLNLSIEVEDIDGDYERNMIGYFINNTQAGKIYLENNQLSIHPGNRDVGWIYLNVSITDYNSTPIQYVSQPIRILVRNINDPPTVKIIQPKDGTEFLESENITFECNVTDIDLLIRGSEERFTYEWTTNFTRTRIIGTTRKLTNIHLAPGNYTITVRVFDSGNEQANDSVHIFVKVIKTETPTPMGDDSAIFNWWLWIIVVIIIIIILSLLFVFYNRHKKKKLMEGERLREQGLQPAVAYLPSSGLPGFPTTATSAQLTQPQQKYTEPLVGRAQPQIATAATEPTPQLPPAGTSTQTTLTIQQKMVLLEERLLAGEIDQEVYLSLKTKYETEAEAAKAIPKLPPAAAQNQAATTATTQGPGLNQTPSSNLNQTSTTVSAPIPGHTPTPQPQAQTQQQPQIIKPKENE